MTLYYKASDIEWQISKGIPISIIVTKLQHIALVIGKNVETSDKIGYIFNKIGWKIERTLNDWLNIANIRMAFGFKEIYMSSCTF